MVAPATLFVVATPIGNLEDITLRALRVLREVDVVAAEDTRRTGNLLRHFQIHTPLLSLHEHNETARVPKVLNLLRSGRSVALVSDAGTPGISDPGAAMVRAVREAGLTVIPVPGPNAVATAISAAGLTEGRFAFAGFPPIRLKDRKRWLEWLHQQDEINVVFFEAPHRVLRTLKELGTLLGKRPIMVGREVTKIHEEWKQGNSHELLRYFADPQGEFVFIILPATKSASPLHTPTDTELAALFGHLTNLGQSSRRGTIRKVADAYRISSKAVYNAIERRKNSGK